jgi:hypothetical protein
MEETKFDPKRRRLCPDGACIGLIGADGRCKVCGRAASGSPVAAVGDAGEGEGEGDVGPGDEQESVAEPESAAEHEHMDEQAESEVGVRAEAAEDGGGGFDAKRKLCDDGSCIGVVGPDGICSVCGRKAEA